MSRDIKGVPTSTFVGLENTFKEAREFYHTFLGDDLGLTNKTVFWQVLALVVVFIFYRLMCRVGHVNSSLNLLNDTIMECFSNDDN